MSPLADLVVSVWTEGTFSEDYPRRLARDVTAQGFRFKLLTSKLLDGIDCVPLCLNLPGWWGKVEMWRPDWSEPFLYVDLSVLVTGRIDGFLEQEEATVTRDFYYDTPCQSVIFNPVGWGAEIWEEFNRDPDYWVKRGELRKAPDFGDQVLMNIKAPSKFWQDALPGQLVSYKKHARDKLPDNARIVKFHGKPRPHQVVGWAGDLWRT